MSFKHIIVIGTSAGGIEALRTITAGLPAELPAPVLVVCHLAPHVPSVLDQILTRAGRVPAHTAEDRLRLQAGHIYIAPPDCHLLVEPGIARVTKGPRENRFRPAVDPLFRSAAQVYGPAAIGVVLTGSLDDGTAGLWAIKQLGGTAIVQDPADAMFSDMPASAMAHVEVDHVVRVENLASLLVQLTERPVQEVKTAPLPSLQTEVEIAKERMGFEAGIEELGEPSPFACPDCHGVLLRLGEHRRIRFRCHTGHAYSLQSLIASATEGIEHTLWSTIRALEEGALLMEHAAQHLAARDDGTGAAQYRSQADDARRDSEVLRRVGAKRTPLKTRP